MRRELTSRHALFFKTRRVRNLISFINDLYRYQKGSELVSFTAWEIFHKLRLFPQEKYLKFGMNQVLTLESENLNAPEFQKKIEQFFKSRELNIIRSVHDWKLLFINNNQEYFGCLYPDDRDLYKSSDGGESIVFIKRFPERIKSIYITGQNTIFVCIKGAVYKSTDNGATFKKSLDLGSSESFFRHNNGMTETPDNCLVIAEYGNVWDGNGWRKLAYLYFSSDNGETWERSDFLIKQGINKHVHLVKYSRLLNKLFMADGDNKKKLWVSGPFDASVSGNSYKWKPVNKFHIQMGGYTSVVESDGRILFGTDYQGGTNFIVTTRDGVKFNKMIVPDPYRRSPIDNMILRKSKKGDEIWANLPYSTPHTKCLLMYSTDGGMSWVKVIEYSRFYHVVWLISSAIEPSEALYIMVGDTRTNDRAVFKISDGC